MDAGKNYWQYRCIRRKYREYSEMYSDYNLHDDKILETIFWRK